MSDLNKEVFKIIKNKSKSLGITQAQLAKRMNVSLPTIKRWYGGGTVTIEILKALTNEVGLTLTEIFSSVEESSSPSFQYTDEQENFFSNNPDYLAFFDNLLRGYSPPQIQKKFRINDKRLTSYLSKLDKLKLVEWLPSNKVRLLVNGEAVWKTGGALSTKLRADIFNSFLESEDKSCSHFFLHDYSPKDRVELIRKINELTEFAKQANNRAKIKLGTTEPAGLYISLQNFRWSIDKFLAK